jgi:fatty acid desaturase
MTAVERTEKKATMPPTDLRAPSVAWPTLLLFAVCFGAWIAAAIGAILGAIPLWGALIVNSVAAFAVFTPMHDASHRCVARAQWVNEVVGRLGTLPLVGPFPAFRFVHLEHHKHTNDHEKDPDHWSGRGPKWLLPLHWMTQDLYYYFVYLSRWNSRPRWERTETLATLVVLYGTILGLCFAGFALETLMIWVIPSRIAQMLLAWTFDYLPHRPHTITAAENRFKASLILLHPFLTIALLYQNYHLIHHLYPGVPFYRMAQIWRTQREWLLEQGAIEITYRG